MLEYPSDRTSFLEEDLLAPGSGKSRGGKAPCSREELLRTYLDLRGAMGDFGFGPGEFLAYLEGLFPPSRKEVPSPGLLEDLYLCLGLLGGAGRAFRWLESRFALRLFQAASRAGFSREEAKDALQETLAGLWRRQGEGPRSPLEGYQGRGSLFAFLRTIFLRKLVRRRAADAALVRLEGREDREPAGGPDPSAQAAGKELDALFRDLVGGALETLPAPWRRFLQAVHLEGRPATRAAVAEGLLPREAAHLRTQASRLHARILRAFRKALLQRAHGLYGMNGDDLQVLLGKEPLHSSRRGHDQKEGRAGEPGPQEVGGHG